MYDIVIKIENSLNLPIQYVFDLKYQNKEVTLIVNTKNENETRKDYR